MSTNKLTDFNRIYEEFLSDIGITYTEFNDKLTSLKVDNPDEQYLKYYCENLLNHVSNITNCDYQGLIDNDCNLFPDLSFCDLWNHKDITFNSKLSVWKYLHTLYILAASPPDDLFKFVEKNYSNNDVQYNYKEHSKYLANIIDSKNNVESVEQVKQVEQVEQVESKSNTETNQEYSCQQPQPNVKDKSDSTASGLEGMLDNSLIGNLAKELSTEIDPSDIGDISNPMDLVSGLLSGGADPNQGIGKIMAKVCQSLDSKMSSGELDQAKLFSEAQSMMGSMGNMNMFQGMANMATNPNMARQMSNNMPNMNAQAQAQAQATTSTRKRNKKNKRKKKKNTVVSEPVVTHEANEANEANEVQEVQEVKET